MEQQNAEHSGDTNLYDLWKVLAKRKRLIIGLFFAIVVSATIISFLIPKVYRGEAVLVVPVDSTIQLLEKVTPITITPKDIVDFIGKIDKEKRAKILPKTYDAITDIKLNTLRESKDKIAVSIEAEDINAIQPALLELIEYIKSIDLVKLNAKEQQEVLSKRSIELSIVIAATSGLLDTYRKLLTEGRLIPVGFNPVELNKRISDIKVEKLMVEQAMERTKSGIEIAKQPYIMNKPVKPKKILIVALSGIASLFLGIFGSFALEYVEIKKRNIS
jgi:hypothetical protein